MGTTYGNENTWTFGDCHTDSKYPDNSMINLGECCLSYGEHDLTCRDFWSDGWHGGYVLVDGIKFCNHFNSGPTETHRLVVSDGQINWAAPSSTPTLVPSHVPSKTPSL